MTLLEVRKMFVKLTGRYDLVKDAESYEDDGADFMLNAGIRMLDSMFTHSKSYGTIRLSVKSGKDIYRTDNVLSIEGIQVSSDEGRVTLTHVSEQDITERDPDGDFSSGAPKYYAIHTGMRNPALGNLKDEFKGESFRIFPAPDENLTAYVYGRLTIPLEEDDDINFWSSNYPETLITAGQYFIERFHRNSQGMADHMRAIRQDLRELDNNAIESQMGSITQMRDSWNFRGEGNEW